jgi:hypothetical protein
MSTYVAKAGFVQPRYLAKSGRTETIHYKNAKKWKTKEVARQYLINRGLNTYYQITTVVSQRYSLV